LIIPFNIQIPDEKQDKELSSKIIENELPGVFNWVLAGLERLINQKNFSKCNLSNESLTNYINTSDSVKVFMDELNIKPNIDSYRLIKDLYLEYKSFCLDDGYRPLSKTNFIKRLRFHAVNVERKNIGIVAYLN
jgi:putative DNA primase/helicase